MKEIRGRSRYTLAQGATRVSNQTEPTEAGVSDRIFAPASDSSLTLSVHLGMSLNSQLSQRRPLRDSKTFSIFRDIYPTAFPGPVHLKVGTADSICSSWRGSRNVSQDSLLHEWSKASMPKAFGSRGSGPSGPVTGAK